MTDQFGQDGTPHLTYYDKDNQLSFVYDLSHQPMIAVSYGGYAEAVIDTFPFVHDDEPAHPSVLFTSFMLTCQTYVRGWVARGGDVQG